MATIQPSLFAPTNISGCTLWLDGADRSTITLSAGSVSAWRDKSGSGNNATASSGPTISTYNGYPVVSFNGSSQYMASTNTVPVTTHTLIAVHRPAVINANYQGNTSLFRYQAGYGASYIVLPYMNGTTPRGYITSFDGTGVGSIDATNSTLVENSATTAFNLIMAVISSGSQAVYKNGTLQSSNTQALSGTTSPSLSLGAISLGADYYQGDLAEMIVYNTALTTVQRQQIEGYLAWKWGIQTSLPSNQPYRYVPPNSAGLAIPLSAPITIPMNSFQLSSSPLIFFNPTTVPGCQLWLDGFDPLNTGTPPANGALISTWFDRSGNGNNLSNVGTGNPTYVSATSNIIYNSTSWLQRTSMNISTIFTFYVVARRLSGNGPVFTNTTTSDTTGFFANYGGSYYLVRSDSSWLSGASSFSDGTTYIFSITYDVNNNINLWTNGSLSFTTTQTGPITRNSVLLGKRNVGPTTENWVGYFSEVLQYNTTPTTLQRQQVEGYLAWKWGLQTSLPSDHPYRNIIPSLSIPIILGLPLLQPATFSPKNVSGCQLWMDAADVSTITLTAGVLTQWRDKSGNANNATNTGTVLYTTGSLNNLNVVTFSGASATNNVMITSSFSIDTITDSFFSVVQFGSSPAGGLILLGNTHPTAGALTFSLTVGGTTTATIDIGQVNVGSLFTSSTYTNPVSFANQGILVFFKRIGTAIGEFRINGTLLGSTSSSTNAFVTPTGYRLGANMSGTSIGEQLIYNSALSTSQVQNIEGYLAWKWGLQGSLPATHPYKQFPPPPN